MILSLLHAFSHKLPFDRRSQLHGAVLSKRHQLGLGSVPGFGFGFGFGSWLGLGFGGEGVEPVIVPLLACSVLPPSLWSGRDGHPQRPLSLYCQVQAVVVGMHEAVDLRGRGQ